MSLLNGYRTPCCAGSSPAARSAGSSATSAASPAALGPVSPPSGDAESAPSPAPLSADDAESAPSPAGDEASVAVSSPSSPAGDSASEPEDAPPASAAAPTTSTAAPPVNAASPEPSDNAEPCSPIDVEGDPPAPVASSPALAGMGVNETTSATESSTRRRALQIPTLFMEGTFQLRLRPAERKGMHTLYCKGWQGPATRESSRRKPPRTRFATASCRRAALNRRGSGNVKGA